MTSTRTYSRRQTLTKDLATRLSLAVGILIAVVGTAYYVYLRGEKDRELNAAIVETSRDFAEVLAGPAWNIDRDVIRRISHSYLQSHYLTGATVTLLFGDEKEVVFNYQPTGNSHLISRHEELVRNGKILGSVELYFSELEIRRELRRTVVLFLGIMLLVIVSIVLITHLIMRFLLKRPLDRLTKSITNVARGDYRSNLQPVRQKDINLIITEVNAMSEQIAAKTDQLQRTIEEHRQTEKRLRVSEERFEQLANHITEVFWITNADGSQLLYLSPAVEHIWGYKPEAFYENPSLWPDNVHPDDRRRVVDTFKKDAMAGRFDKEYRVVHRDGTIRWVRDRGQAVLNDAGEAYRIAGIVNDITRYKKAEQALLNQQEQVVQLQKMEATGRLAAGIAHDFNNLLTTILGYSRLAKEAMSDSDAACDDLAEVIRAGESASDLTRQLLAFSHSQPVTLQPLDLNAAIAEERKLLERTLGEDMEIITLPGEELWRIEADPLQLQQIVINLAVNARDAMPRGGTLTIQTENVTRDRTFSLDHPSAPPGEYVKLSVRDTGEGIPTDVREHMFEPFFTTKEIGKGTGLGLSTVYGIVRQWNGHIEVDSTVGEGTNISIFFPRTGARRKKAAEVAEAPAPKGTETILLAEDEEAIRLFSGRILRELGYRVMEATDGEEAVRCANDFEDTIHLVLSDVVMPKMGGPAAVAKIRAIRPNIKVLYISGYPKDTVAAHTPLDIAETLILKPFKASQLAVAVREVLDEARQDNASMPPA